MPRRCLLIALCPILLFSTAPVTLLADTLLQGARIIDGSGQPAWTGDLRIADGRIAAIGDLRPAAGDEVIDAGGLVLAPGFIDTHSHADGDILNMPDALAATSQGITTAVVGLDGGSPFPLADFVENLQAAGSSIHFAAYVGHNTIRHEIMGDDFRRVATPAELDAMRELMLREYAVGAIGLSTGLEYDPGIYSDTAEVLALAQAIADRGGRYISHMRSEDRWLADALEEILHIGRETGMPVQISHFKLAMKSLWHSAPGILARLDAARAEGVDITADVYPYEFWQSNMMVLLPERDPGDRAAVKFALDELAPPDGIWLTRFEPQPEYVGKRLTEIAGLRETDPVTTYMQLAQESLDWTAAHGESADSIIGTSMIEEDIHSLLAWEHSNVCTDGGLDDLHPRARGSFPRVLGRYVREQGLFSLETAVHKMTALAARHMGITDRGLIRPGLAADLVLFDPDTVIDRATPDEPDRLAEGIHAVWVAGELVFENGAATENRPGTFLRQRAAK